MSKNSKFLDWETRRYCPRHSIDLDADPEKIWSILENFDAWSSWNPLYVKSSGSFEVGNSIQFAVALPGMKPHPGVAKVKCVVPREFLQYEIKSLGGLGLGTRFIEIRQIGPGKTQLINGEIMSGLVAPLLFKALGEKVRQGLENMNIALAAQLQATEPL